MSEHKEGHCSCGHDMRGLLGTTCLACSDRRIAELEALLAQADKLRDIARGERDQVLRQISRVEEERNREWFRANASKRRSLLLEKALSDALELAEEVLPYVGDYLRKKWSMDERAAEIRARAALSSPGSARAEPFPEPPCAFGVTTPHECDHVLPPVSHSCIHGSGSAGHPCPCPVRGDHSSSYCVLPASPREPRHCTHGQADALAAAVDKFGDTQGEEPGRGEFEALMAALAAYRGGSPPSELDEMVAALRRLSRDLREEQKIFDAGRLDFILNTYAPAPERAAPAGPREPCDCGPGTVRCGRNDCRAQPEPAALPRQGAREPGPEVYRRTYEPSDTCSRCGASTGEEHCGESDAFRKAAALVRASRMTTGNSEKRQHVEVFAKLVAGEIEALALVPLTLAAPTAGAEEPPLSDDDRFLLTGNPHGVPAAPPPIQARPEPSEQWAISRDQERYEGDWQTREQAIAAAPSELDLLPGDRFWVGRATRYEVDGTYSGWEISEKLQEQAGDEHGEWMDGWPDLTDAQETELEIAVNLAIEGWLKSAGKCPKFFTVNDPEECTVATSGPAGGGT